MQRAANLFPHSGSRINLSTVVESRPVKSESLHLEAHMPTGVQKIRTTCCIAGGGPAGMMLGFLLARGGVKVIVLEKHRDFFRDFRGDTIHPSTLEVMNELGLLDRFLKLPHQELRVVGGRFEDAEFMAADFSHLP